MKAEPIDSAKRMGPRLTRRGDGSAAMKAEPIDSAKPGPFTGHVGDVLVAAMKAEPIDSAKLDAPMRTRTTRDTAAMKAEPIDSAKPQLYGWVYYMLYEPQ